MMTETHLQKKFLNANLKSNASPNTKTSILLNDVCRQVLRSSCDWIETLLCSQMCFKLFQFVPTFLGLDGNILIIWYTFVS